MGFGLAFQGRIRRGEFGLQTNLKEVLELCLEEYRDAGEDLPRFIGLQQPLQRH
ncbi:MAG: hypothetical protein OJF51_004469 [Nitrospira sp.]|nr:MAG: hypothetical protein OJF51_004469 [Nitrospira sp.]